MKRSTYNKHKYEMITRFIKELEQEQESAINEAKEFEKRCIDEETGEIDETNWNWEYREAAYERAEAYKQMIMELDKI